MGFLAARQFQTSSRLCASKDAQGKDDLKPEPNEISKSGSDDQAAAVEDAAFNPKKTSPEDEYNTAGGESAKHGMNNPLDVSPANHEVSKPRSGTEGGHEGSSAQAGDANGQRARTSGVAALRRREVDSMAAAVAPRCLNQAAFCLYY